VRIAPEPEHLPRESEASSRSHDVITERRHSSSFRSSSALGGASPGGLWDANGALIVSNPGGYLNKLGAGGDVVDWEVVLTNLQREKKRAIARQEEQYVNRSLFCLESSSSIRELCIKLVELPAFTYLVLVLILTNCCFLLLEQPLCKATGPFEVETQNDLYQKMLYVNLDCSGWPALKHTLDVSETFFTVAFTLEMVLKIIARGFVLHKHAYLRDGWNRLDAIVVVASILSSLQVVSQGGVFKTIRVLRPLRMMTRIKGMQPLINTIVRSIYRLFDVAPAPLLPFSYPARAALAKRLHLLIPCRALQVLLLLIFCFVVFSLFGIDLFGGKLRGRCFVDPDTAVNVRPPLLFEIWRSMRSKEVAAFHCVREGCVGSRIASGSEGVAGVPTDIHASGQVPHDQPAGAPSPALPCRARCCLVLQAARCARPTALPFVV